MNMVNLVILANLMILVILAILMILAILVILANLMILPAVTSPSCYPPSSFRTLTVLLQPEVVTSSFSQFYGSGSILLFLVCCSC